MLGRDATRNPAIPEGGAPVDWDIKTGRNIRWKARLGTMAFADPVVGGGLVWIGTNNQHPGYPDIGKEAATLMAFRERDGRPVVDYSLPPLQGPMYRIGALGLNGSPLLEDGRLWFVTARAGVVAWNLGPVLRSEGPPVETWKRDLIKEFKVHHLLALEPAHRRLAQHTFDHPLYASPIFANGVLYVAVSDDHLYAITKGPTRLPRSPWRCGNPNPAHGRSTSTRSTPTGTSFRSMIPLGTDAGKTSEPSSSEPDSPRPSPFPRVWLRPSSSESE